MTQKFAPDQQINLLEYVTHIREENKSYQPETTVQDLMDTFIGMVVVYKHAPRIYEVTEDGQGIAFNTRTEKGWDELLRDARLHAAMDKLVDGLKSSLTRA